MKYINDILAFTYYYAVPDVCIPNPLFPKDVVQTHLYKQTYN